MTQTRQIYAVVVYWLTDGKEERQSVFSSEELKHERASAEREKGDPKGYVRGYSVESPTQARQRRAQVANPPTTAR